MFHTGPLSPRHALKGPEILKQQTKKDSDLMFWFSNFPFTVNAAHCLCFSDEADPTAGKGEKTLRHFLVIISFCSHTNT